MFIGSFSETRVSNLKVYSLLRTREIIVEVRFVMSSQISTYQPPLDRLARLAVIKEVNWRFSKREISEGLLSRTSRRKEDERLDENQHRLRRMSIAFLHESVMLLSM